MADENMGCKANEEKIKTNPETVKFIEKDDIKEDEVESIKAEMTGVREENLRLKSLLQQVEKDYKTLKMRFMDIIQHKNENLLIPTISSTSKENTRHDHEHELVSLRLGTVTDPTELDKIRVTSTTSNSSKSSSDHNDELKLGLECNFEETKDGCPGKRENGVEGVKLAASKVERSAGDEEFSQTSVKRARVCVRARCDTTTMNDGCQWRKYGQKISKGNPCPRSYYRCTVSSTCPVRKQVQRSAEDMSILTTTYEGTHNHPLPISATAMASTTSAAASMLLSGSTTSQPSATTATSTSLYRPHFQSSNNSTTQPYYYNSSPNAFPTITLDLTANPSAISNGFGLSPSSYQTTPRVPATSQNFSSMNSNMIPTVWGTGGLSNGALPYDNHHALQFANPLQEQKYQPYLEKFNQGSSQQALTETLTKVITTDPSFRSVIEAAISSMAANGGPGKLNNKKRESLGTELKWGNHTPTTD